MVLAEDQGMVLGAFASLLSLQPDIEVVATAADGLQALDLWTRTVPTSC